MVRRSVEVASAAATSGTTRDAVVIRLAAAIAIAMIGLVAPMTAFSQSDQGAAPGTSSTRQLTKTIREPVENIACEGGTVISGQCACPAAFSLLPASSGKGGTCVRTNADTCRGGDLTADGTCLCNGRVTMSGETYALELVGGKCIPKRCPLDSYLKAGQCVASNDRTLGFTCRTGYIPDGAGSAATGLHCVPDPTFCPAEAKRKNGSCATQSAIAIDCFDGRCTCGPNASFVNYLCQCTEPYRNVGGSCVAGGPQTASHRPETKPETEKSEPKSSEPSPRRKACAAGTVRTKSGNCVAVRPGYAIPHLGREDIPSYYSPGRLNRTPNYPIGTHSLYD